MRHRYLILASVLGLAFAVPSLAQTSFSAVMNGANEVGPVVTPATGTCSVVLNAAQTEVSISCSFQNLIGTYTASHLHGPAAVGVNAGVRIGFVAPTAPWVFSNSNHDGTLTNYVAPILAADVTSLFNGLMYVNVHSSSFPGGEIRGQLGTAPVPTKPSTWSRVKAIYR